ncbi:MAG TPA: phenylphosphate carboxylase subunit delta [Phycisphaerales bacterium]|nr:phenylphosphate carboxylase subunit delta [Phycisphaerales bacterium]
MLVMDVDGVLTDGTVMIHPDGTESKKFHLLDGHGIKMWHRTGLKTALISGRASQATTVRAEQLNIAIVHQGCKKKLPAFESLLEETSLDASQVAYIGDDLLDLPLVKRAGFGVAVANAVEELRQSADYITSVPGGCGAVREVIEHILKNTGKWDDLMQRYLV